jgi:hypothetical protein
VQYRGERPRAGVIKEILGSPCAPAGIEGEGDVGQNAAVRRMNGGSARLDQRGRQVVVDIDLVLQVANYLLAGHHILTHSDAADEFVQVPRAHSDPGTLSMA